MYIVVHRLLAFQSSSTCLDLIISSIKYSAVENLLSALVDVQ